MKRYSVELSGDHVILHARHFVASVHIPDVEEMAREAIRNETGELSRGAIRVIFKPSQRGTECQGHGRGGLSRCCDRAGEYNGFGSDGGLDFLCPKSCSCHD